MKTEVLSNLVITKVHSISTIYTLKGTCGKRIDRPSWAIAIKYEGETFYHFDNVSLRSDIKNIIVLPKGCSYEWECTKAGHFSIIEFDSETSLSEPLQFPIVNAAHILKRVQNLERRRMLKGERTEMESLREVYTILLALLQASDRQKYYPSDRLKKIEPAIEYILQNYNKPITNESLASIIGVSCVYFRKLFTSIMGISPIAYLHEIRIQKAKEMLSSDHGSMADVAQSLGYTNLYDFSRDFKKRTGLSPSQYKLQNKASCPPDLK